MKTAYAALLAAAMAALPATAAEPVNGAVQKSKAAKAEPVGVKSKVSGAQPCCAIASINAKSGLVTLKDVKSGKTFNVTVKDKAKLGALRVGQNVDKNL